MPQDTLPLPLQTQDARPPRAPTPTRQGEPRDGTILLYSRNACDVLYWVYVSDGAVRQMLAGKEKPLPYWIECEHKHGPTHPRLAIRCSIHEAPIVVRELALFKAGRLDAKALTMRLPRMDHHKFPFHGGMTWERFSQDIQKETPELLSGEPTTPAAETGKT